MTDKFNLVDRKIHYSYVELLNQVNDVKKKLKYVNHSFKSGKLNLNIIIKPTKYSIDYMVTLKAKVGSKIVETFVKSPQLELEKNGRKVPHMFPDGSLCLYYYKKHEFDYHYLWSETLIPWTSLWLYYYQVWHETGEWLGGGAKHGRKKFKPGA